MSDPLLEFTGIEKAFYGVKVLRGVSFQVPKSSAVGLVGENGAGKSTLMNILGGNLRSERGSMSLGGKPFAPATPQDAASAGIAFIHQELNLFPNLTIAENLFLTRFPTTKGVPLLRRQEMNRRAEKWLGEVGLNLAPGRLVETLSAGERQLVEIAKALSIDARLIIFDEPTTSLSARETEHLFGLITRVRAAGISLIYISHFLEDVFRLCDRIVVLRDGEVVGNARAEELSSDRLVSLMVGRAVSQVFPPLTPQTSSKPLLQVENLSLAAKLHELSFTLHPGEILGIAGMMGAGRSELAKVLFGLLPLKSGTVRLEGKAISRLPPRELVARGVAFLTEDRQAEGLCLDGSVADNISLASARAYGRTFARWVSQQKVVEAVQWVRKVVALDVKTSHQQSVRTLSGGNQQKVVLGKWLLCRPRVLILDEPTRGVDVGAKFEIYQLIRDLASAGTGILLISSELEELIGLCDRILVMRRGRFVEELPREKFDRHTILRAALGTEEERP